MPIQEALQRFSGTHPSFIRTNCAESVGMSFHQRYQLDTDELKSLKRLSGGRAPHNACGAYYAALLILQKHAPQLEASLKLAFKEQAGSLSCKEIKSLSKKSCKECVKIAAQFLHENLS